MRTYHFNNWIPFQEPGNKPELLNSQPQNVNNVTTVTSGYSWDMSGFLGFSGLSGTGSLGSSVSFSESQSFPVSDVTVNNNSENDETGRAEWTYIFANPRNGSVHFYYSDLEDAPILSRSNFQPVNRWIWEVDRINNDKTVRFNSQFSWINGKSVGQINTAWIKTYSAVHENW